jgi:hypothetical protein
MVVPTYNPSYQEREDGKIVVQGQPQQKLVRTVKKQAGLVACPCHPIS